MRFGRALITIVLIGHGTIAPTQDLRFQHLTAAEGLTDNAVTCVFEDRKGYIWIGTERGLNRYDGQRVEHFPPGDSGPLGTHITSIAEDSQGRMWITTADAGLSRRDTSGAFKHYQRDSSDTLSLPTDQLNHVLVLSDTLLILGTRGKGAVWFDPRTGVLRNNTYLTYMRRAKENPLAVTAGNWCHSAVRLDDQRILMPMLRTPTLVVDAHSGEMISILVGPNNGPLTHATVIDGAVYLGGWTPGIYRTDAGHADLLTHFPIDQEVTSIVPWGEGHLMAATKGNGLIWLNADGAVLGRSQHARTDPTSVLSDRTTCLLYDRSGNLWVGTAKGMSVHAPAVWRFAAVALLPDDHSGDLAFHNLQQDDDGSIRISTSKGFILVDPRSETVRHAELHNNGTYLEVTGMYRIGSDLWAVGTETGMFRYDPEQERILMPNGNRSWSSYRSGKMFQTRAAWSVAFGGRELLLVGALGYGHVAMDPVSGANVPEWIDYPDRPNTMMLRATVCDAEGVCWSATAGGVIRWRPVAPGEQPNGTAYNMRSEGNIRLPGDDAQALVIHANAVWVALRDAGLARIKSGHAKGFIPPAHMPHDALGVAVDTSGKVWTTTSNGLLRYDPATAGWLHVPVNDGREFRQLTKCIITLQDGRLAFCANGHLLLFDPAFFDVLPEVPAPAISGMRNTWGTLQAGADGTLELPFRNSAFDAMLTALRPTGATPLTFLYRLDSEGSVQHGTDARAPLRYAGVPVGSHTLRVRVRDPYGREGPEVPMLTVKVIGPFWQQWWFFLIVLGAGAMGMYLVSRLQRKQRARLQGVRDRIARDLHDDIGSTLGSISFYSEALRRKLSGSNDGMTQEVAEKIGSSSREMIDRMSDIVWSVDPKNDDAGALIERLQAFAKDLLSAKNIALDFRADPTLNERKLSAEQRRNLFLICKEALYNTVKYADASKVSIAMAGGNSGLSLIIADDGRGFDPENTDSYNGNGLVNMRARADAIHALITVTSSPGKGTQVKLSVPAQLLVPRSGD